MFVCQYDSSVLLAVLTLILPIRKMRILVTKSNAW